MKHYKAVLFDMDGTLADTSPGIYDAHHFTIKAMKIPETESMLDGVIGASLLDTYHRRFGLSETDARYAIDLYRERYRTTGLHMAHMYPGMIDLLTELQAHRVFTAVATLKLEAFAHTMLTEMNAAQHFDRIYGMDAADTLTKGLLLQKCCSAAGVAIEDAVLIGDSTGDAKGAASVGMDLIGVTYGFGFRTHEDVLQAGGITSAANVDELRQLLLY